MATDYAKYREAGRASQLARRATTRPIPRPHTQITGLYQLSPEASKGNAFCWLTWEGQIEWVPARDQQAGQAKRNAILDEKRAAGIDPAYIPGMNRPVDLDPKRFTVYAEAQPQGVTKTEQLRRSLRALGPARAAVLSERTGIAVTLVHALLKHDLRLGRVTNEEGLFTWVADSEVAA